MLQHALYCAKHVGAECYCYMTAYDDEVAKKFIIEEMQEMVEYGLDKFYDHETKTIKPAYDLVRNSIVVRLCDLHDSAEADKIIEPYYKELTFPDPKFWDDYLLDLVERDRLHEEEVKVSKEVLKDAKL